FWLEVGRTWQQSFGDFDRAETAFQEARRLTPNASETWNALATLIEGRHGWDDLVRLYQQWLAQSPSLEQPPLRVKLHFLLFYKLRRFQEALDILKPILERQPDDHPTLLLINRTLGVLKMWPELADNLSHLAEISTDPALVRSYLLQRAELS